MDTLENSFIERQIRRTNRNLVLVNGVLLAGLLAVVALNYRYAINFVRGPKAISTENLLAIQDPEQRAQFFVQVTGDRLAPTGFQHVEQQINESTNKVESESVKYDYKALKVGERWLLVKAPGSSVATGFSGALVKDSEGADVVGQIEQAEPGLKGQFLPFVLDTVDYRDNGYWALGIGIPILVLLGWNLAKWAARTSDRSAHPIIRKLRAYGEPEMISMEIENEITQAPQAIGVAVVTRSWLFAPFVFGLKIARLPDVVWAYKKVIRHYHSFIPTGKTYSALLFSRSGESFEVSMKEKKIDELLQGVAARVPWVIAGFSNEIQAMWKNNRAALIQAVDEKRAKLASAASASSAHA